MKPAGWPRYMQQKQLRDGSVAYYWSPQVRDLRKGCLVHPEALGPDYGAAIERARLLNVHLDAWRAGHGTQKLEPDRRGFGTVGWLFDRYQKSSVYERRVAERSRYEYRRALKRIEDTATKTGGVVADLPVASITPAAVDKIYAKLQQGKRGKRTRQADLSIDIARRAWSVMRRLHPTVVPAENPWTGLDRVTSKTSKPAATRQEVYALANALKELGEPHLGAAALICFEWHQRPEHVRRGDITWADYRPPQRPDAVFVRHPKTGEKGWLPLADANGPLYPEITAYLDALPKLGLPIVLTKGERGPARPYSDEYAQRRVREARKHAKLGSHVTLDTCRHGGMTELGDAGATEAETMASSMHKTPNAARLYVKRTEQQRSSAARKRRQLVEGNEKAPKVGIEGQTKSRNER